MQGDEEMERNYNDPTQKKDIYNNKIVTHFYQMFDIHNITTSEKNRPAWSTYDTEEDILLQYQKTLSNDQNIPAKQQIPEREKKRPKWPSYKIAGYFMEDNHFRRCFKGYHVPPFYDELWLL